MTIVVVALALVALLAVVGLVIDGGRLFSDHRQVQNTADAAALAGAAVLQQYMINPSVTADQINTAVTTYTANNASIGSTAATLTCYILGIDYGPPVTFPRRGLCSSYSGRGLPADAYAVEAVRSDTQDTSFLRAVPGGARSFNTAADAAAAVEATTFTPPASASADLVVCAAGNTTTAQSSTPNTTMDLLLSDGLTANPAAIGQIFHIRGNSVSGPCGTGSQFKGLDCKHPPCPTTPMPGSWGTAPGNHSGPIHNTLLAACDLTTSAVGCTFALPLCVIDTVHTQTYGPPDYNGSLYCTTFGTFQVTGDRVNSDDAKFTGQTFVSPGGSGGGGIPGPGQASVIRLLK